MSDLATSPVIPKPRAAQLARLLPFALLAWIVARFSLGRISDWLSRALLHLAPATHLGSAIRTRHCFPAPIEAAKTRMETI